MTDTEVIDEILNLIKKNGRVTKKYLFDVFVIYRNNEKYKAISAKRINKALTLLLYRRDIFSPFAGSNSFFNLS